MKRIKRPVYEEVLKCEYCGSIWTTNTRFPRYSAGFVKCSVCKKEGCGNCVLGISPTGEKYIYHEKCYKGLPESILKAHQEHLAENDRRQRRWDKEYGGIDHIC